ncbi:T9SS type A sorting domain-containing protein [Hymenobacter lucidus]|uniref:T9SS type A sorting domain-containing protein n=1 Tax=Hymenobacter lucidus TaxID=2880930 RepID=A0ABS8AUF4_9BACT|nr:T9SS type A sorting domain-containing protein [Hymenobacter lucidus]MCB2409852.1 T9SS type A sorting domain-containing protein [Hymenobacter lucidus]
MKKLLSLTMFLGLWFSQRPAFAHKEWVHQYMVKQSYLYLEQQIGAIPALRDAIGLNFHGKGSDSQPFNNSYPIGIGAWREDSEDPVYGYKLGANNLTPSITHFWDADNSNENYESMPLNITGSSKAPNAWEKARVYLFCQDRNGAHDVTIPFIMPGSGTVRNYIITYTSLPELYKGNYFLEGISNTDGSGRTNYYHWPQFNQSFGRPVALQLLGRVAHLLGDMSVPAHTHSHLHPCPANLPDHYENDMGNTYASNNNLNVCESDPGGNYPAYSWSAATAAQQGGILSDIYCLPNDRERAKYLFYTVNQLADFFPSGVNYADMGAFHRGGYQSFGYGDANLSQGSNAHINAVYNSFNWTSPNTINTAQIANVNFNFAIRSVATLFQWFALDAGIIADLKNQKIGNSGTLLCANGNLTFDVPTADPFATNGGITWSIEPAEAGTGTAQGASWSKAYYNVTPAAGYNGILTVKASYTSTYGCFSSPVTLTRQVWVGGPSATFERGPGEYYIPQGSGFEMAAGVSRPELEGAVSYQWTLSGANGILGNTSSIYVEAPWGYDQYFELSCTVTNACGLSSTIYRGYRTAPYTGGDGQSWRSSKQQAGNALAGSSDELEVFPNPSNTSFEVIVAPAALLKKADSDKPLVLTYTLRDNLGRVLAQGSSPAPKVQIDTHELPAGVYSLSCSVNGQTFHKRVQVLH